MAEKTDEGLPTLFEERGTFLDSLIDLIISIEPKELNLEKDNEDIDDIRVISIDADWGYGKTTFKKHLNNELNEKGFTVFTFNAWKNDYEVDAFNSFIRELIPQMMESVGYNDKKDKNIEKFAQDVILGLNEITKFFTRFDGIQYKEDLKEKKELISKNNRQEELDISEYNNGSPFEKMQKTFKERLNKVYEEIIKVKATTDKIPANESTEKDKKIVILIDELDRCRPTFAVELLERVKHLFDTGKYLFIFTICAKQLKESVRQIYGNAYEETGYFRRFFDYEFLLPNPDIKSYLETSRLTYLKNSNSEIINIIHYCFSKQNISLRDCEKLNKFIKLMLIMVNDITPGEKIYLAFCIFLKFIAPNIFIDLFYNKDFTLSALDIGKKYSNELIKINKSFEFSTLDNENKSDNLSANDFIYSFIRLENSNFNRDYVSTEKSKVLELSKDNSFSRNYKIYIQVSHRNFETINDYTYFVRKDNLDLEKVNNLILFGVNSIRNQ